MTAHIPVDTNMLMNATQMGVESFLRFKECHGYYENTPNSHIVGKIGELACARWAENLGIHCDQAFRDLNRKNEADLILNLGDTRIVRIEVKTWSSDWWQTFGRCIAVRQMRQVRAKADIVIWCASTPYSDLAQRETGNVNIAGWNTPAEIARIEPTLTGRPGQDPVRNHQVPMEQVRPLDELDAWLRGEV